MSTELQKIMLFFLLEAAWVRSRAERPSVREVSGQLHVQFGCKLTSKLAKVRIKQNSKQITNYEFQIRGGCSENRISHEVGRGAREKGGM